MLSYKSKDVLYNWSPSPLCKRNNPPLVSTRNGVPEGQSPRRDVAVLAPRRIARDSLASKQRVREWTGTGRSDGNVTVSGDSSLQQVPREEYKNGQNMLIF